MTAQQLNKQAFGMTRLGRFCAFLEFFLGNLTAVGLVCTAIILSEQKIPATLTTVLPIMIAAAAIIALLPATVPVSAGSRVLWKLFRVTNEERKVYLDHVKAIHQKRARSGKNAAEYHENQIKEIDHLNV